MPLVPEVSRKVSFSHFMHNTSKLTAYLYPYPIEGCYELIIVFRLFEDIDFDFLLLARKISNALDFLLTHASVLVICTTHHHMITGNRPSVPLVHFALLPAILFSLNSMGIKISLSKSSSISAWPYTMIDFLFFFI